MFKSAVNYRAPENLIVVINIIAVLLLSYKDMVNEEFDILILGFEALLIFTIYLSTFILKKISSGDHFIFLIVTLLMSIGTVMIYRLNPTLAFRQIMWIEIGLIVFFLSYIIVKQVKKWRKWTAVYLIASLVLFLITLIFGKETKGATNWIAIGNPEDPIFSFQPSELIKIFFTFYLASYYFRKESFIKVLGWKTEYIFLATVYIQLGFLFIQKDLGSALLFYLVFISIFYIFDKNRKLILVNLVGAVVVAIVSYIAFNHVQIRVNTWLNPWPVKYSGGYQITQSLFAIASGGFFGRGLGSGQANIIPEVHTDFIYSAICEEMGTFTGIAIILLFFILIYRGFKIALQQQDKFYKIVALGTTLMIGFQAFIILGGVTKFIPLTGITLPFVSYGGSSLLSSFAFLGILQVTSEDLDFEQEEDHEFTVEEND